MFAIVTKPTRNTRRNSGRGYVTAQLYAYVQGNGKFRFVNNIDQATQFASLSDVLYAVGRRAQQLRGNPTHDLTVQEVTPAPQPRVQGGRIWNGR